MIKIAHLYYDLLNLYGEQGNILALKNAFKNQNVEVSVDLYSVDDEVDFKNYDIVYIGSGSLESLKIAAKDIKRFARKIKNYIESDKYLIATGSSYLLFGKSITYDNGEVIPGLNIFDYYAKKANKRKNRHRAIIIPSASKLYEKFSKRNQLEKIRHKGKPME